MRLSGPDAFRIARAVFRERGQPPEIRGRGLHVGWVLEPESGEHIDQAVLLAFPGPASYTTEDVAELQGHGGPAICGRILRVVLALGARLASRGEFTRRAFLGGRIDLAQAEAIADLIEARGERALDLAARQLEGRLSRAVNAARSAGLDLLARIEAVLDFPDDVDGLEPCQVQEVIEAARGEVHRLLGTADTGRLARAGATVALVGRPNVGKSSLLNALVQADRAIVTAIPGTTRDVLESPHQISGIPVTLLDSAGIRDGGDELEALGVGRSRRLLAEADLRVVVVDGAAGIRPDDRRVLEAADAGPTIHVASKADLDRSEPLPPVPGGRWIRVSARTGEGLAMLEQAILEGLGGTDPACEIAVNARHHAALLGAATALERALEASRSGLPLDCVASDVREAVGLLGQVVGTDLAEDMLDLLFSRFCVGK